MTKGNTPWPLIAIVVVLLAVVVTRELTGGPGAAENPSFDQSKSPVALPDDAALATLTGERIPFSSFHGKVVFLNVWATWCPPCVKEMPSIVALHKSLDKERFAVVMASQERPDVVEAFRKERGFDLPYYLAMGRLPEPLVTGSIPATFVLDKQGRVRMRHIGMADWSSREVKDFLERIAAE